MNEIPDLAVWAHRWSDFFPRVIGSIAEHVRINYNLIVVAEPGNCHDNMQRVIDRSRSRFLCFMDEDIMLLDKDTIPRMIEVLKQRDDIALVVPMQLYTLALAAQYKKLIEERGPHPDFMSTVKEINMCAAYCLMVDREKMPDLYADRDIPTIKGFTDADMSLQAEALNLRRAVLASSYIYHVDKKHWTASDFKKYECPLPWAVDPKEMADANNARHYVMEKWRGTLSGTMEKGFDAEMCVRREVEAW
ncbi:MAG: hypothetical protein ACXAEN_14780 [Candidatus Thorarchaeota archaeon]|jgi:hypothetical protein